MVRNNLDCKEVIKTLHSSPTERIGEHFKFLLNTMVESTEAFTQIERLMQHLKQYLWFLDYKLVKEVISKFASNKSAGLLEKVAAYESDVGDFRQTTSIAVFARSGYHDDDRHIPEHYTEMEIKHKLDPDQFTLMDLEDLQKCLRKALFQHEARLCILCHDLLQTRGGVTWLIPETLVPNLMAATGSSSRRTRF